ncbi:transmembrane protein 141-like [Haliotis rufescens]|uniref:transmembrane protein 141-like n=1 Tax=Haliotis rufescens TaxID=6454 RepID=UPI001EAFFEC7|nr:transmembrane protein 141-like [Haliotis rufescens]
MNRKVPEELKEKYPHYETYAKCQSSAFMAGTFTFATATAGLYVVQELLKTRLPYAWSSFLLTSVLGGSVVSYVVTRKQTKGCQDMWMAMEDRHTALTSIDERKKMEKTSPNTLPSTPS